MRVDLDDGGGGRGGRNRRHGGVGAAFIEGFLVDEVEASRSLNRFDLVAARINPPPPPPPPGYPPIDLIARLEANLRVLRVPVLVAAPELQLDFEVAGDVVKR